jgi:hypothetical protein
MLIRRENSSIKDSAFLAPAVPNFNRKRKWKDKTPEERHVIGSKIYIKNPNELRKKHIAPLELIFLLVNSIDILPRWGKILKTNEF